MTTDIYSMFETNAQMETDGVWIVYGADKTKDPQFKVARAGGENLKYQQALMHKMRPYQRVLNQAKSLDSTTIKMIERLTMEAWVDTCLLDWRFVTEKGDADAPFLPFSKESALALFTKLPELYRDLFDQSSSLATFRQEEVEEAAKN